MAFPDVSVPADSDYIALGAGVIRAMQANVALALRPTKDTTINRPAATDEGLFVDTTRNTVQRSTGSAWEDIASLEPIGVIKMFGAAAAPTGYLLCNGAEVSQTTYAALYAILGTTWNTGGEGAGNFRLPDMMGRVPVGVGAGSGLTSRALADKAGAETHTNPIPHTHHMPLEINGTALTIHDDVGRDSGYTNNGSVIASNAAPSTYRSKTYGTDTADSSAGSSVQPFTAVTFIIKAL